MNRTGYSLCMSLQCCISSLSVHSLLCNPVRKRHIVDTIGSPLTSLSLEYGPFLIIPVATLHRAILVERLKRRSLIITYLSFRWAQPVVECENIYGPT